MGALFLPKARVGDGPVLTPGDPAHRIPPQHPATAATSLPPGGTLQTIFYPVRLAHSAKEFMLDVAGRIIDRVQLTSDGHKAYLEAVESAFGFDVDYSMLVKMYGPDGVGNNAEHKYSPGKCNGLRKVPVIGLPDKDHISTSYVERQNLTLGMSQRRFTRLTNSFSKNHVNHEHTIALHYLHYNFIRRHKTLGTTPAVAAGITDREWTMADLVAMLEAEEDKLENGGRINCADRSQLNHYLELAGPCLESADAIN